MQSIDLVQERLTLLDTSAPVSSDETSNWRNCFGTAFYLVGYRDEDAYETIPTSPSVLAIRMGRELHQTPVNGAVIMLITDDYDHDVIHMGVVTNTDPIEITHRHNLNGPVIIGETLESLLAKYERCLYIYAY